MKLIIKLYPLSSSCAIHKYTVSVHRSWAVSTTVTSLFSLWSGLDIQYLISWINALMPLAFHHYLGTYLLEYKLTYLHIQDDQKPWYGSQMFLLSHLLIRNEMFEKCLNSVVVIFLRLQILDKVAWIMLFFKKVLFVYWRLLFIVYTRQCLKDEAASFSHCVFHPSLKG